MRKHRRTSAAAVITLALGIGATTAIFTVADALLLRPLPYRDPSRLVKVDAEKYLSWPRARMLIDRNRSFDGLAAYAHEVFNVSGRGDPEQVPAARVTSAFFEVLGVAMSDGRGFTAAEDTPAGDPVVVVSYAFHQRRPEPHLTLDGKDYTVVGVLPPGFHFVALSPEPEVYAPRVFDFNLMTRAQIELGVGFLDAVGRLRPGVSPASAKADLALIDAQYRSSNPALPDGMRSSELRVEDLRAATVVNIRPAVLLLSGAVALVFLIACANVAGLLLARAVGRRREIAVRAAIGATRGALLRQLLAESGRLAVAGGVCGLVLSTWGTAALAHMDEGTLPRASEIRPDGFVLLFALGVSLLSAALFGLIPALAASRADLNAVLRADARGATGGRARSRLLNLLIVGQVALSMALVCAAGVLLRNLLQLRGHAGAFQPRGVLTMNIALPPARYARPAEMIGFYDHLLDATRTLPGVEAVAISSALPANRIRLSPALPEGQPDAPLMQRPWFNIQTVSPGYVAALRVKLLRGREFTSHDHAGAEPVAMINETAARRFWPGGNPIGRHILVGRMTQPSEIVGVLGDIRNAGLATDVEPEVYLPYEQLPWASMYLNVRAKGYPWSLATALRQTVYAIDRDQPVTAVRTLEEVVAEASGDSRFTAVLVTSLAALALALAVIGIYGAISYTVAQRSGEMGVRIALGASRSTILAMVLRQGLTLAVLGIAIGVGGALAFSRLIAGLLYHVSPADPLAFLGSAAVFAAAAALASYIPARRAASVDAIEALR